METKICSKCKRELPLEDFRWRNKAKGTKHSQCKYCESEAEKERYKADVNRRAGIIERDAKYKNQNNEYLYSIMEQGCAKCGEKRLYVLDFHHIDKTQKKNNINHLKKSASLENLKEEVAKCIVLCSNCHREFHFLENKDGITIQEYLDDKLI